VDRLSKFFHQVIREKILCVHMTDFHFTCYMLLHYLVEVKNPKKCYWLNSCYKLAEAYLVNSERHGLSCIVISLSLCLIGKLTKYLSTYILHRLQICVETVYICSLWHHVWHKILSNVYTLQHFLSSTPGPRWENFRLRPLQNWNPLGPKTQHCPCWRVWR